MSVILAYQSLNSNAASTHHVAASTQQVFTRSLHNRLVREKRAPFALHLPDAHGAPPDLPVYGPAQLVGMSSNDMGKTAKKRTASQAGLDDDVEKMLGMFQGKARQFYQHAYRAFGKTCNLLVFGEVDSSDASWAKAHGSTGRLLHTSIASRACNCFSIHSATSASTTQFIDEGDGWVAVNCNGVRAVFVHVPNKVATDDSAATVFYQTIKKKVLNAVGGGVVDVILGDTNQPNTAFSPRVISAGMSGTFKDAHVENSINPIDTYKTSFKGTNSADSKPFDVVIINTATVSSAEVKYLSQLAHTNGSATALTDHMGILVKIKKNK